MMLLEELFTPPGLDLITRDVASRSNYMKPLTTANVRAHVKFQFNGVWFETLEMDIVSLWSMLFY